MSAYTVDLNDPKSVTAHRVNLATWKCDGYDQAGYLRRMYPHLGSTEERVADLLVSLRAAGYDVWRSIALAAERIEHVEHDVPVRLDAETSRRRSAQEGGA